MNCTMTFVFLPFFDLDIFITFILKKWKFDEPWGWLITAKISSSELQRANPLLNVNKMFSTTLGFIFMMSSRVKVRESAGWLSLLLF